MTTPPTFTRRFCAELPGDANPSPATRQVHAALWSAVAPTAVAAPRLLAWSAPVARELGLAPELTVAPETAAVLAGNGLWPGMQPFAANYGGHQFGNWAGQLGDGRAIVLGELCAPDGRLREVQLKGAGPTPYSRRGDGRAVLRSSLREFLCSEAMHWLGVPTTRALSLVSTGDDVIRDMFYDGNPQAEPGAVVCRVAETFVRFGSFELCMARGDRELLRQLTDFTLRHFYAELGVPGPAAYAELFYEVARRTARLLAQWQAVGFVHGVMNTDNMSILGLTIDYGPYGWVDDYDPRWTPNTTDAQFKRYCFGNQPSIGLWNTQCLGVALAPLFDDPDAVEERGREEYRATYAREATDRSCAKLGITFAAEHDDGALLDELFAWLAAAQVDMTLFFRDLAALVQLAAAPAELPASVRARCYAPPSDALAAQGQAWLERWWHRTRQEGVAPAELARRLDAVNPRFVLRNWVAQEAIDAATRGDLGKLHMLLEALETPFVDRPEHAHLAQMRPEWARHKPGCSALSCSS